MATDNNDPISSDLETRKFALCEAVKICSGVGAQWHTVADCARAAMLIARLFELHLDPPPPAHVQADAKRESAA